MARVEMKLHPNKDPFTTSAFYLPQTYPAVGGNDQMAWTAQGQVTINDDTWNNTTNLACSGDPTTDQGATLKVNTGANQDMNALWECSRDQSTERMVRGVWFKNWTNGAKFRPRITGVALAYRHDNNGRWYQGLQYRSSRYDYHEDGKGLNYEGTSTGNYYMGVAKKQQSGTEPFQNKDMRLSGVIFHVETTWKTGSAEWCNVYITHLRFITDGDGYPSPTYYDNYRVWGLQIR